MKKRLKDIAEVKSGYTFREGLDILPEGDVRVLQSKDVDQDLVINVASLPFVGFSGIPENAALKSGDVVLTARNRFQAAVVNTKLTVVASSSLMVIRSKRGTIDPEYLVVYLNSLVSQAELNKIAKGGGVRAIHKQDLEGLEIPLPSLVDQRKIVEFYKNISSQRKLLNRKLEINAALAEAALSKVVTH